MASPYDDLLGLSADPFRALLAGGFARRREPAVPDLPPEEQNTLLGNALETGIGGLGYLGKVADKTFGGRAVRGLLGGRPEELLSVLPFSDTLGITDERNAVQGTDLNAQWGLTTPGDDSWQNLGAGLATEILLDPATYLGLGPLTRAGKLAEKAGALPRGLAAGMRGFDVAESAVKPILAPGERATDVLGDLNRIGPLLNPPVAPVPGARATTQGVTMLPAAVEAGGVATGEPLRNLFGLGLPFLEPAVTFGSGATAQRVARGLDRAGELVAASAPVRALRAAFDPSAGGAYTRGGQQLAADTLRPTQRAIGRDATERYVGFLQRADPFLDTPERQARAADVIRLAAEDFGPQAAQRALLGGVFNPHETTALVGIGEDMGKAAREFGDLEGAVGLNTRDLTDAFAEYMTRRKNVTPKPGESPWQQFTRQFQEFSTTHGSQMKREERFQDVMGGTVKINDWSTSPRVYQMVRQARASGSNLPLEAFFRQELTGSAAKNLVPKVNKQAEDLAKWAVGLPDAHFTQGVPFFRQDPFADFLLRGKRSARARAGAETVFEGVKRFAAPLAGLGDDAVPLEEVFRRLALDKPPLQGGVAPAHEIVARRLGLANPNQVAGYGLPADVARDVMKLGQAWENPRELTPLLAAWDAASNLFKTWVTAPFPAFHARNLMSGIFNMWRDDVQPNRMLPAMREAYDVLRGGTLAAPIPQLGGRTAADSTQALIRAAVADRVAFTREAGRAADTAPGATLDAVQRAPRPGGTGNTLLGDLAAGAYRAIPKSLEQANPLNVEGVNRLTDTNSIIREMRALQGKLDDFVQLTHYIAKLRQGYDPATAGLAVKKYHNDYLDMTGTERNVMKRLVPWYCMPVDHEILTRDGWKFYDQIEVGDEVMAYDHEAGTLHWTPLLEVAEFDYDGELMVFECRGSSFEFTPNHRWPVERVKTVQNGRAYGGERVMLESHELNTMHRIPLTGDFRGEESVLSPRLAAILGWVATDGYMRWQCQYCEMTVYQSEKKGVDTLRRLLGVEPRQATDDRQEHRVYTFAVKPEDVNAITDHIQSKQQLAEVAGRLSREAAEAMYQAMMQAEGSKPKTTDQEHFAQSHKNWFVRDAFQVLCVLTGRSAFQTKMGCYIRKTNSIWPKHWLRPNKPYKGKIWCPRTKYGTWVVRHAGAVAITGNTFSRRSLPPLLEDFATKPAKVAGALRLTSGVREPFEFVPDYVAEGASVPVPGAPEGQQRYVSSFGLPIEDEAVKALGSLAHGDLTRTLQQVLGMTQPLLKAPVERAFGTQLFSGRRLDDLKALNAVEGTGLLNEENARLVSQVLANTPASRFFTTADKFLDPRKGTLPTLLNLGTGVRVSDVDAERQRELAARRLLEGELRGRPGVRVHESVYVPADKLGLLDPVEMQLYRAYRTNEKALDRKAKERAKQRESAKATGG